ncbi:hypothetical protein CFK37_12215 [Virgibacillus phasianinus]|uniref:DUF4352 domain-containing protein n=1 Tax=Virgibacillus phasianinus TaxID=2017483 RepID=A0A220U3W4_9BACI|nr:DUF4352 domain-containing protein [Virgibacillus phasianinus]ASK62858.1 hypothetical protein CFK37_12215 [Virgibacillus phasianinus]
MKKILVLLFATLLLVVSACDDSDEASKSNDNDEKASETTGDNKKGEKLKDKRIYRIGETAEIFSSTYDFPYEVTVNSFKLTTDAVEGVTLADKGYDGSRNGKFAVVNVTIKNTSDRPFVPKEKISAQLLSESVAETSDDKFFKERNEELKPGEEVTGNLVYTHSFDDEVYFLTYEQKATTETKFELPVTN